MRIRSRGHSKWKNKMIAFIFCSVIITLLIFRLFIHKTTLFGMIIKFIWIFLMHMKMLCVWIIIFVLNTLQGILKKWDGLYLNNRKFDRNANRAIEFTVLEAIRNCCLIWDHAAQNSIYDLSCNDQIIHLIRPYREGKAFFRVIDTNFMSTAEKAEEDHVIFIGYIIPVKREISYLERIRRSLKNIFFIFEKKYWHYS